MKELKIDRLSAIDKFTSCRHSDDFQVSLSMLSLPAKRVLYLIMAQMYTSQMPKKDDELTFVISAKDFSDICGIQANNAYKALSVAMEDLQGSVIYENVREIKAADSINITRRVRYHYEDAFCTVTMNHDVHHYFFELSKGFTTNNLYEVARISEVMTSNLYQVIMKRYSKGHINSKYKTQFEISVNDLKDELGMFVYKRGKKEYKYPEFRDLKRKLKTLISLLEKETSFSHVIMLDGKKERRKISTLKFFYYSDSVIENVAKQEEKKQLDKIEKNLNVIENKNAQILSRAEKEKALKEQMEAIQRELLQLSGDASEEDLINLAKIP